jgi:dienelactone hydrolase
LALTITKSDAGVYARKLYSLDQGAYIAIDTITVNSDAVRWEIKSPAIVFEGVLNKERTELTGKYSQGGQQFDLTFKRSEQAAVTPPPKPKPDYSAPADAPYIAEEVTVKTTAGHTLAGTLTLPKGASSKRPVSAIVTIAGSGPQDRDANIGAPGFRPFRQLADSLARRGIAALRMDDLLILTGSHDQQAVPEQVALMEAAFKESGNKNVTARVAPDANHLFVQDTDGFPGNYTKLPAPVMMRNDVVLMIGDWLAQRLRQP